MDHFVRRLDEAGRPYLEVDLSGFDLMHHPLLNKGTAFSPEEREEFALDGLLPPHVSTLEEQIERVYENYSMKGTNLEKYIHLRALQDRNETLFFALVNRHVEEMTPIIYTPTVGEAVQKLSHIYRIARGLWITPANVERMDQMAASLPSRDIRVVVVTDNQGILGIGDQGAGGMGIPIGKLSLYTLGAGIDPAGCLPISLDVGTDNQILINDPLYLGHKKERLTGADYDRFIDRFVTKVKELFPNALLQWEDFSKQNAFSNLERYRDTILSFNDDVQGTGAVVVAGVMGGVRLKHEKLEQQTYAVYGAGAGGMGVALQLRNTLMARSGLSADEAASKIYVIDSQGVMTRDRVGLEAYKMQLARDPRELAGWSVKTPGRAGLVEAIRNAQVTVLLGLSGQPNAFDEEVVAALLANTPQPLIFPLSNPTSKCEAKPADLIRWSRGAAIVATGSPFAPVEYEGCTYRIGQGNNVFIFPGVGLAAIASGATKITDEMFTAASIRLADLMPADAPLSHCVFPRIADLHKASEQVALAVYEKAFEQGVATADRAADPLTALRARMWAPTYVPLHRKRG
ncbi:MAG: NAD-dependent malic enzyme [Nitrospinae bacterium]|nr:NAD-dependent malic enzyme [Nitrospinota bacterium]